MKITIMLTCGLMIAGTFKVGLPTDLSAIAILAPAEALAQVGSSISADGTAPNTNAILDVQSPSTGDGKGMLIPRITENQRTNANASLAGGLLDNSGNLRGGSAQGLIVYQTNEIQGLYFNTSQSAAPTWVYLGNGTNLNMNNFGITNVARIDFRNYDVSVGLSANGSDAGAAVGYGANGYFAGAAVGYAANGFFGGATIGGAANGGNVGAAVGYQANGSDLGAAVGGAANGRETGAAVGYAANGSIYGAAIGRSANGANYGVAVGYRANAIGTNIAIGAYANALGGKDRIAIGRDTTNSVDDTARIRGTLYLDGGDTNIYSRPTFGSGSWIAKTFEIDHPLDPENKILRHYCLEGPQVWNVYAGNVQLVNGQAVVQLPDYYSALNLVGSEIYGLTPLGDAFVWIAKKVSNNCFVIAGKQDIEVSWTIKVLRNDPGCREDLQRRPVEEWKSK